ncbi:alpha/beta hydrolase [Jatrophihabitans endophyticus]|uniref:alpha/beta fold hydrolase n=1 Tax=Jatrophihabitans endophyticus TaxID=1206085 RepID=UPI001A00B968|nr:alpha/beta hydrolase [Jatrophihabitans endophyticus]MBE7190591.1 alpha/beta fold hydrolase [Jatrophihabitans endophyticus]
MSWQLDQTVDLPDGTVRWCMWGDEGDSIVLVHGTPYSSYLWRDIAPALARSRRVFVFDHLGYGQSDKRDGQDLTIAAQARNFVQLLAHWGLEQPSVVANDIGGAIVLRALLLEGAAYSDMTLFDCVSGGDWEGGLFAQIRRHHDVFAALPGYAHQALVASHLRHATFAGYRPGVLEAYLEPWLGADGQAAFYRQYRQLSPDDTAEYEHLLGGIDIPVRLLWGRQDRIVPPPFGEWLRDHVRHESMSWVDDAGHLLQEDAPAQLLSVLSTAPSAVRPELAP